MPTEHARPLFFLLAMLPLALLEWWWRRHVARRGYDGKAALASLAIGVGHVLSAALTAAAIAAIYAMAWRLAPHRWPLHDWRTWLAGFVAVEFAYYGYHRASHTVRWMWATHAVHHTPEEFTLFAAIRLGWTHLLSLGWLFYLPLVLAGFDPRLVGVLLALDLHYQFFLHTEAVGRLGPLEWVLNTPAHHRVHHASNPDYLDCNYGGVLIVFDRLFGTLREERAEAPIRYGLTHPLPSRRPLAIVFGEWQRLLASLRTAHGPRQTLRILFGRP